MNKEVEEGIKIIEKLINSTPSGHVRNRLTDVNIILHFIKNQPVEDKNNLGEEELEVLINRRKTLSRYNDDKQRYCFSEQDIKDIVNEAALQSLQKENDLYCEREIVFENRIKRLEEIIAEKGNV